MRLVTQSYKTNSLAVHIILGKDPRIYSLSSKIVQLNAHFLSSWMRDTKTQLNVVTIYVIQRKWLCLVDHDSNSNIMLVFFHKWTVFLILSSRIPILNRPTRHIHTYIYISLPNKSVILLLNIFVSGLTDNRGMSISNMLNKEVYAFSKDLLSCPFPS